METLFRSLLHTGSVDETLAFFIEKLLEAGKPAPSCADEACVIGWVQLHTQVVQSVYDSALSAGLSDEDMKKVEDLYRHVLQEIQETGLSSLGVLEV